MVAGVGGYGAPVLGWVLILKGEDPERNGIGVWVLTLLLSLLLLLLLLLLLEVDGLSFRAVYIAYLDSC